MRYFLIIFFFLFQTNLNSFENKIILKIDNEIITNLDLENEIIYLTALNPNLKNLNKTELIQISKKSLIQEIIKKIEIQKNFENPKISPLWTRVFGLAKKIWEKKNVQS